MSPSVPANLFSALRISEDFSITLADFCRPSLCRSATGLGVDCKNLEQDCQIRIKCNVWSISVLKNRIIVLLVDIRET